MNLARLRTAVDGVVAAAEPAIVNLEPAERTPGEQQVAKEWEHFHKYALNPVVDTMTYASHLGLAAVDHLRGLSTLLGSDRLPVFAALPVARATIDAATLSFWLAEPRRGTPARVQRGIVFRLQCATGQLASPRRFEPTRGDARRVRAKAVETVDALGWGPVSSKDEPQQSIKGQQFPNALAALDALLKHGSRPAFVTDADLTWWHYAGHPANATYPMMLTTPTERPTRAGVLDTPMQANVQQLTSTTAVAAFTVVVAARAIATWTGSDSTALDHAETSLVAAAT